MNSGTMDTAKGRVNEAAGVLARDDQRKHEGELDQVAGKVKDAVKHVVGKAKDLATRPKRKSAQSRRRGTIASTLVARTAGGSRPRPSIETRRNPSTHFPSTGRASSLSSCIPNLAETPLEA